MHDEAGVRCKKSHSLRIVNVETSVRRADKESSPTRTAISSGCFSESSLSLAGARGYGRVRGMAIVTNDKRAPADASRCSLRIRCERRGWRLVIALDDSSW